MFELYWALLYLAVPIAVFLIFLGIMRIFDGREKKREFQLVVFFFIPLAFIACVGAYVVQVGDNTFIIVTAALAQTVPITVTTFRYSETKSWIDGINNNNEIRKLQDRIDELEEKCFKPKN